MPSSPLKSYHPRLGWLCMFLGLYPIAFALNLFPIGDTTDYAPMWIIFLCGLAFVMAGSVLLVKRHSRINTVLVTSILVILGAVAVWAALFSPGSWFGGGFNALNEVQNIVLARWMFGIGAILSFIMSAYGLQQFLLSLIRPYGRQVRPLQSQGIRPQANRQVPPRTLDSRAVTNGHRPRSRQVPIPRRRRR